MASTVSMPPNWALQENFNAKSILCLLNVCNYVLIFLLHLQPLKGNVIHYLYYALIFQVHHGTNYVTNVALFSFQAACSVLNTKKYFCWYVYYRHSKSRAVACFSAEPQFWLDSKRHIFNLGFLQ